MKTFLRLCLIVSAGFLATTASTMAQLASGLFVAMAPAVTSSVLEQEPVRQGVVSRTLVGLRLDQVFANSGAPAATLRLNIADRDWVARFERLDTDITGFRSWVGTIDGIDHSHVVITERDGVVSALINAVDRTYQIRTTAAGLYVLEQVDTSQFGIEQEPFVGLATLGPPADSVVSDNGTSIDVLMLYTPAAETAAGGGAQIAAIASQIISDTNTIFSNSDIIARVRLVGATSLSLTESATLFADLNTLTNSATAQALRNTFGADLVQLLVDSPDLNSDGIAWLWASAGATDFTAYSVAKVGSVAAYTPSHELGHNMGSNHAPEDGATGGVFPYSLGFKDSMERFRTVMANACPGNPCPRIPHMSSQWLTYDGHPTGNANQNNAFSINATAFTIANWRQEVGGPVAAATPVAPTNVRMLISGMDVRLLWDAVAGATDYRVQIGTGSGLSNIFYDQVGNITRFNTSLPVGNYFWRVYAINTSGTSAASVESPFSVTTTCGIATPPRNLVAWITGNHVILLWEPPDLGQVLNYVVEAGSFSGGTDLYNDSVGGQPLVQAVAPFGAYFVRVRALNGCGLSAPSDEVSFVVGSGGAPPAPQDLRLTLTATSATASWDLSAGAQPPTAFIVEAGSAPGLANLAVFEVDGQTISVTVPRPAPGVYHVRVRARNGVIVGPATADSVLLVP